MNFLYKLVTSLQKHPIVVFFVIFIFGFLYHFVIFKIGFFASLYDTTALFAFDIRIDDAKIDTFFKSGIYLVAVISGGYTLLSVITPFIKAKRETLIKKRVLKTGGHIVVIGLSSSSRAYLDSIDESGDDILVLADGVDGGYLQKYEHSLSVVSDRLDMIYDDIDMLNISDTKHIFISTGSDMDNLEIATKILSQDRDVKMFIQIEDRSLRYLHKENGLLSGRHIRIYSHNEESARWLFEHYDIDGKSRRVIDTKMEFSIAVVGDSALAYEVIAQGAIMGQLPNENRFTIYCIDSDIKKFRDGVELHFPQIYKVPNLSLEFVELDYKQRAFYLDTLWEREGLSSVILCYEDEQKNLDIASTLLEYSFVEKIVEQSMDTQIIMAMPNGYRLGDEICSNLDFFKYLYTFATIKNISDDKYIVAGDRDKTSIATHFIYENIAPKVLNYDNYTYNYTPYDDTLATKYAKSGYLEVDSDGWDKLSYLEKESNRSVSEHIKMKLKALNLISKKSKIEDKKELYLKNREIFLANIKDRVKLAKMEHNRWSAFHYIHGYKAIPFIPKEQKRELKTRHSLLREHICLVDFDEFKKESSYLCELGYSLGEFEGYDFMINEHIPLILANAGYEIESSSFLPKSIKVAVTGHRKGIDSAVYKRLFSYLDDYLKESEVTINKIISPLADGADSVVAKEMIKRYGAELIVALPFELEEYKKTISNQDEFLSLLAMAKSSIRVSSLEEGSMEYGYMMVGEYVVDSCDLLIVLWNGDSSNGLGGTADVFEYAKMIGREYIYINTQTEEIQRSIR